MWGILISSVAILIAQSRKMKITGAHMGGGPASDIGRGHDSQRHRKAHKEADGQERHGMARDWRSALHAWHFCVHPLVAP